MPGPHLVYAVTAVVVLGLVAWVIVVLSRPAAPPPARAGAHEPSAAPEAHQETPRENDANGTGRA